MESLPWSIIVSGCSLTLSVFALYLTHRQKVRQDKFGSRKALSDAILGISNISIEMFKIRHELDDGNESTNFRRTMNAQRRFLAFHAELLTREIPKLTADMDHLLIAGAFSVSDPDQAKEHYEKAIEKSNNKINRSVNIRAFASFMFGQGEFEAARKLYEKAVMEVNDDSDRSRRSRVDILLVWANAERRFGFSEEEKRRVDQALTEAGGIGNEQMRERTLISIKTRSNIATEVLNTIEDSKNTNTV